MCVFNHCIQPRHPKCSRFSRPLHPKQATGRTGEREESGQIRFQLSELTAETDTTLQLERIDTDQPQYSVGLSPFMCLQLHCNSPGDSYFRNCSECLKVSISNHKPRRIRLETFRKPVTFSKLGQKLNRTEHRSRFGAPFGRKVGLE